MISNRLTAMIRKSKTAYPDKMGSQAGSIALFPGADGNQTLVNANAEVHVSSKFKAPKTKPIRRRVRCHLPQS
jgi:hypothetical protein